MAASAGRRLTVFGHHSEGDRVACVLDELDDVVVRQLHDGLAVDGGDTVAHPHPAQSVGGAALDDAADLVRYDCGRGAHIAAVNSSVRTRLEGVQL